MQEQTEQISGIHGLILSIANVVTYIVLGIILIFFFISTYSGWGIRGVIMFAMTLLGFLFVAFLVGFILSQLFPDRRSSQFAMLFNIIEGVLILIITLAGVELAKNTTAAVGLFDGQGVYATIKDILGGNTLVLNKEGTPGFITKPGLYWVTAFASSVLKSSGGGEGAMSSFILGVHVICAFITYRVSRTVSGRVASVAVYAAMMLIPSQVCSGSVICLESFAALFVMLNMLIFAYSRRLTRMEQSTELRLGLTALSALALGVAMSMEPAALILPFAECYYVCAYQRNRRKINPDTPDMRAKTSLILVIGSFAVFFILTLVRAIKLSASFFEVMGGYLSVFKFNAHPFLNVPLVWSTDSYADAALYFHSPYSNQIAYGCVLGSAFICVILSWVLKDAEFFVARIYLLMSVFVTFFSGEDTVEHISCFCVMVVLGGALFEGVYSALRLRAMDVMKAKESAKEFLERITEDDDDD
ncbi:MAG: hypothetical protein IKR68_07795, partial [Lachnospiraceae bacterium]|nr:hypothetical protein [Lachnospiraceae bacterium]